jgi:transposase
MSITDHKHMSEGEIAPARRIEVFTGAGRRRAWTLEEKAAIVAESFDPNTSVSQVARNHGLTPTQLFTWRREARRGSAVIEGPAFVPAMVERSNENPTRPVIELDIGGDSVWVWRDADADLVTAVICALKKKRSDRT